MYSHHPGRVGAVTHRTVRLEDLPPGLGVANLRECPGWNQEGQSDENRNPDHRSYSPAEAARLMRISIFETSSSLEIAPKTTVPC